MAEIGISGGSIAGRLVLSPEGWQKLWHPIETYDREAAPYVLGYDPRAPDWGRVAVVHLCFDRFAVVHDREDYAWADYDPTHWMPLPEPPQ